MGSVVSLKYSSGVCYLLTFEACVEFFFVLTEEKLTWCHIQS